MIDGEDNGEQQQHAYRTGSDSEQHDLKQRLQVDILLEFLQSSRNYCVCIVDIVNSTEAAMGLPHEKIGKYYGLFLNRMAELAGRFGALVVKNVGDSLLFYFPKTDSDSPDAFRAVMDCAFAMLDERPALNRAMVEEGLPQVSYRISCEYGQVAVAKVSTSSVNDIFGTAVNLSSKINHLAIPNGIVVGEGLYRKVKDIAGYLFHRVESDRPGLGGHCVYAASKIPSS